jgi:hypothetical protein
MRSKARLGVCFVRLNLFLILGILLLSCDDKIEKKLNSVADDIIANPSKLYDIKNNFKEYYNEKYASCYLSDPKHLTPIVKHIESDFNKINTKYYIIKVNYFLSDLKQMKCMSDKFPSFKDAEFYYFCLCKDNDNCFYLLFVKPNKIKEEYFFVMLYYGIGDAFKY